ncbi:MAG TPA: rhamnulokinase family protein [Pirellulales bacterium]|nr:rhamnulokinase family protein [Pirellulales bacterium]
MAEEVYLAVDMGASGGRVLAGLLDGRRLRLEEIHRFENGAIAAAGGLYWDVLGLWSNIVHGLRAAGTKFGAAIKSVGVDTWGVDFALLGRGDVLLESPHSYRDPRADGMLAKALARVPRAEIFAKTGAQFMEINTLYQLLALSEQNSPLLEMAESFLMMPDVFHWLLTGVKANEYTNATTTQFYNPVKRRWATGLLGQLGIPSHFLGEIADPGTNLGKLRPQVAAETGLSNVSVVLPGTHDTASAVMAVPAAGEPSERPDWCYISSGTWSLMGAELPNPVVTEKCMALSFTNEGGVGHRTRLLKNIVGLWLVQECRRIWKLAGKSYSWDDLNNLAVQAPRLRSLVNPDHPSLMAPRDMPAAIRELCQRTGQHVPSEEGGVIRTAIESLALRYRQVLASLEELSGGRVETIHVVGGGTQNRQLCQATADACGRRVVAGPVEATAIGNVMVQALAAGTVGSIAEARDLVRESFPVEQYEPRDTKAWEDAAGKFAELTSA